MSPPLEQRIESDSSFERLYRLHRRDVYGAVLRDVRDPAEAEDVTQIAFLNAFRAMRKGEHPDKPRAWLVTIARNVIRRRYRDLVRRPQEVALDPEAAAAPAELDGPTAAEITGAIGRLPEKQRTVILLREIQGRSYAEIAGEMGLSLAAVETLIFRARRSLSEELEHTDRIPATQNRKRGFFFLPIPGLSKLSLGFTLSRAGVAALVGGVAIVAVPMESGADRMPQSVEKRARSVVTSAEIVSPTALPPVRRERAGKQKKERAQAQAEPGGRKAEEIETKSAGGLSLPEVDLTLPEVPSAESVPLPPLPIEVPPPPEVPPLPELPPPPPPPLG